MCIEGHIAHVSQEKELNRLRNLVNASRVPVCCVVFLVTPSCILRRTKQDRQCAYNVTMWRARVTVVSVETQQCVVFVLLSYVSLSVNIERCATMLLWTIYVAGNSVLRARHVDSCSSLAKVHSQWW
jgi:hypothetical protein